MKKIKILFAAVMLTAGSLLGAAEGLVSLSCDYPGGNVKIVKIQPGCAEIAPDLRDNRLDWFYWNFDAVATQPGTVHFCFPKGQSKISAQGPAVSTDGGKTWQWLGKAKTHFRNKTDSRDRFEWTFSKAGEKVRFAQGIPYQKERFETFYEQYKAVPYMKRTVLTKTRKGVDSPMLIIGSGPKNILVTARHHACEAIASYVQEGFVTEALSNSPAGKEFRKKYTLYVVPFIDLDGVEAGDQGKNRAPHDHNRDYALGDATIYPEIKALQALDKEKKFFITLDMHAPSVRNDIHEAIYFAGFKTPSNKVNTAEFKAWLDAERPADANAILVLGGGNPQPPDGVNGVPNARYFATNPTTVYGMTFEIPYASGNPNYNEKTALQYGKAILKALLKTEFSKDLTPRTAHKEYVTFVKSLMIGRPDHAVKACNEALAKKDLPEHYRTAALVRRAFAYGRMKTYAAALADNDAVIASPYVIQEQKYTAVVQKTAALCAKPETKEQEVDRWAETVLTQNLASGSYLYEVNEALYAYYTRIGKAEKAVNCAKAQLPLAPFYDVGKIRNRIMNYELKQGNKEGAIAYARETVAYLKSKLYPTVPTGVFGPRMVIDYVEALAVLPETTVADLEKAAELAFNHKICYPHQREYLKKKIETFKNKGK
ncbi:MAG: hypothetical protein E7038_05650 [Lentisphaerae bacterium]|nr:hypothetical protein [Lentisphaerota bacterium]